MRPAPDDLIVTRHVGAEAFGIAGKDLAGVQNLAGKMISDAAYSSTSLGSPHAGGLGGVTLHIAVPKGTPIINAAALSSNPHEREILLGRGTQLAISQVKPNSRFGYDAYATVIGDAPHAGGKTGAPDSSRAARFAPMEFTGADEAQKWIASNEPHLDDRQREAVGWYTGPGAVDANMPLRRGETLPPEDAAHVAALDSAMSPLPADLTLTRVVGSDAFGGTAGLSGLKGKMISDPAFSSTSLGPASRDMWGDVLMHIAAPAGTPAVIAGTLSRMPKQREVILPRGVKLAVAKVAPVKGPQGGSGTPEWEMWLRVVPGE